MDAVAPAAVAIDFANPVLNIVASIVVAAVAIWALVRLRHRR